jgi:hypothetical protein
MERGGGVLEEAWPAFLVQFLSLSILLGLGRRRWLLRQRSQSRTRPVKEALEQARLETVQAIRERILVLFAILFVFLPLLGMGALQLRQAGKMDHKAAWSFGAVCGAIVLGNLAAFAFQYRTCLRPRQEKLEQCLRSLDGP